MTRELFPDRLAVGTRGATLYVMGRRRAAAWSLLAVTVVLDAAGSVLYARAGDVSWVLVGLVWVFTLASPIAGALVVHRLPSNRIGWLLVVQGPLVGLVLWPDSYLKLGWDGHRASLPGVSEVTAWSTNSWPLLFVAMATIGYVFPNGRALSAFWRRWQLVCFTAFPLITVGGWFAGGRFDPPYQSVPRPLPAVPGMDYVLYLAGLPLLLGYLVGAALSARSRLKQSSGIDRLQLLWFAWLAMLVPLGLLLCLLDNALNGTETGLTVGAIALAGTLMPLAISVAILRYQLFDIEYVVSKTLVYTGLVTTVAAVYAGLVFGLGSALHNRGAAGFLAVFVVALLVEPVRSRLHRRAQHWVYGDRADPYVALARLGDRLSATLAPLDVLKTVCDTLQESLRLSYVGIALAGPDGLRVVTESGRAVGRERRVLPLTYQGATMGELTVEGGQLAAADKRLLADLARQAGVAVHAVRLSVDLQHSRSRLVTAQEEERRRLRRDLHDGLGPELAAVVMRLDGARQLASGELSEILTDLAHQSRRAVAEIRRLVEGLRPPALDELGLVGALEQQAQRLSRGSVAISVVGPTQASFMPAAVEVAAYRIAVEAMTNAVRHAHASSCRVEVALNGHLEVVVRDDGVGITERRRDGVGLRSMQERAAELGGTCGVTILPEGGTEVLASIPT